MLRHCHGRGVFGFVLLGADIAQGLLDPFGVVRQVDVFENAQLRFIEVGEVFMVRLFVFQRPEEPFHRGTPVGIVTTPRPTHRTGGAPRR